MNVVQILPALNTGGVERGTLEIARVLVKNGHQSSVISAGGRLVEQLESEGSKHHQLDVGRKHFKTLFIAAKLARLIQEIKPDIVHVRSRLPAWVVHFALKKIPAAARPKLVSTVHGTYSISTYSAIMMKGDRVIAVSEHIRRYILENYPQTEAEKIRVIPRGVDPEYFTPGFKPSENWCQQWYHQYPNTRGKKLLVLPARITRWKGHEDLIELMQRLGHEREDIMAVIVGDAEKRKRTYLCHLKKHIKQLKLENRFVFTGYRADMREILTLADLVLVLSRRPEAFGRTALEALSLGTPVIAYDHGGSAEILGEMFPRGLVHQGDIKELLEKTVELLTQEPKADATLNLTLERMTSATMQVYEELLSF